jgi:GNAT superfamily N-acetyltransferase
MTDTLKTTSLEKAHLEGALALSKAAGWPHRLEDWQNILAVSRGSAVLDGERIVGTGICSAFDGRARLNMIIVDESMRGRGLGRRLVEALLALAGEGPVTLVATEDGFPLYRKFGFEPAEVIAQWQGILNMAPAMPPSVQRATSADLQTILAMDHSGWGGDRASMLLPLLERGEVFISKEGFAVRAAFGRGTTIGPVVARDLEGAKQLLAAALQGLDGKFVRIDSAPHLGLIESLPSFGFSSVGDGTTMHRGSAPKPGLYIAFCLASQALG